MSVVALNLRKRFGSIVAIDGVNFSAEKGETIALVGPNGAGKTTLLKLMAGILRPDEGRVLVNGFDAVEARARRSVGFMTPMDRGVYWRLTAMDNLIFFGTLYGLSINDAKRRAREVLELMDLEDRADNRVATFSTGMMRRLELARALIHDPDVLLLDEPTSGIDVDGRRKILDYIRKLRDRLVIIASHDPQEISLATRVLYFNKKIVEESGPLKIVRMLVKGSVRLNGNGIKVTKINGDEFILEMDVDKFSDLMREAPNYVEGDILDVEVEVASEGRVMSRRWRQWE
ncbi:multidrug ABC transporter ATP-binding protein [Thermocladium modestius]|uniref:Multidrug ABC transporter ATP-binding protein n=1 Tax=Thermocladium modestius TaxID=62609 RepID=A0A830GX78_9CREN|nr:ABC transporter ATP-binding protein [Thermocladium modestius]GGP21664.1 multidrug ABC transporter ATP-binding protein [Thermocladium modestius]